MGEIVDCTFAEYCKSNPRNQYCWDCGCKAGPFKIDLDCTACFRCVNNVADKIARDFHPGKLLFCDECHRPVYKVKKAGDGKFLCKNCYLKKHDTTYLRTFDVFAVFEKE